MNELLDRITRHDTTMSYQNEYFLDLRDDLTWLIRWNEKSYPAGRDKARAIRVIEKLNKAHRPSLEMRDNNLIVCWNMHEKGEKCEFEVLIHNAV